MPTLPSFVDLLTLDRVVVSDSAPDKRTLIRDSADRLAMSGLVLDRDALLADLEDREARLSTGVGEGLALPHTRTSAVSEPLATMSTLVAPVEWGAIDGEPVDLVVMFATPESERSRHVRLLAQISRVLSTAGVRRSLADATNASDVLEVLRDAEQRSR